MSQAATRGLTYFPGWGAHHLCRHALQRTSLQGCAVCPLHPGLQLPSQACPFSPEILSNIPDHCSHPVSLLRADPPSLTDTSTGLEAELEQSLKAVGVNV